MSELRPSTEAGREMVSWWERHNNPEAHRIRQQVIAIEAEAGAERDRLEAALRGLLDAWDKRATAKPIDSVKALIPAIIVARAALRGSEGTPD